MKKLLVLFLALCMAMPMFACGGNPDPGPGPGPGPGEEAITLTIYVDESNVYGAYVAGTEEEYVKSVIEEKFEEDTGVSIDLNIIYLSHANFGNQFGGVLSTGGWTAAVSYLGQAGLQDTVLNQDVTMNLKDVLMEYGENITEAIDADAMKAVTTLTQEVIGIPSVNETKQKGILVRKDLMTAAGYTESKAEADASNGALKYVENINDFTAMLQAMKANGVDIPLSGNFYDLEFTLLAGAYNCLGYQYNQVVYEADGTTVKEVVPGWIAPNYEKVLQQEYDWNKNGLWESDNDVITGSQRLQNFINNESAVYVCDPTITNLIDFSRQVSRVNTSATWTILDPINGVDGEGNTIEGSGAFVEVSRTTDCLVVNRRADGEEYEALIQYIDWMYSSKDNYELCAYGVKGEHWVEAGDDYYDYPEEFKAEYEANKPYSGVFALLHNDEISNRAYNGYSEEEKSWITRTRAANSMKDLTDGMLFYNMPAQINQDMLTANAEIYTNCAVKAWNGTLDPSTIYTAKYNGYRNQASNYIEWLTEQYNMYLAARA